LSPPAKIPTQPAAPSPRNVRGVQLYIVKAQLFRVLGHPLRIRILEILVAGERTVRDLQAELDLDSSGTSQHLAALRRQGLLDTRRAGTSIYYRLSDPRVSQLLAVARQILTTQLSDSKALLSQFADDLQEPPAEKKPG
jgi:ArsR family transcriptional regulator